MSERKSIEEHKANGTYRPSLHANTGITIEKLQTLDCPEEINSKASMKWEEIIPPLLNAGTITVVDKAILTDAFLSFSNAQDCLEIILESFSNVAEYLQSLNKIKDVNLWDEYNKSMDKFNKIMCKFGVTPETRAKLKVTKTEEKKATIFDLINETGL